MTGGCITDPFGYLLAGLLVGQASVAVAWFVWAKFHEDT